MTKNDDKIVKKSDIRLKAMDLLAMREHAKGELAFKLSNKFSKYEVEDSAATLSEMIYDVLSKLEEDGLLSDERFAEFFIRSRVERGQGPMKIRFELRQKDIAEPLIEQILEQMDINWYDAAQAVYDRKYQAPCEDQKERQKRQRFLASRGFPSSVIYDIVE